MKKIFSLCAFLALTLSVSAQLAWDSVFNANDWKNAQTVISKTENVSWSDGISVVGYSLLDGSIGIGKLILIGSAYSDEFVLALPQVGLAEKLYFAWHGGGTSARSGG